MRTCIGILSWNAAEKLEHAVRSALAQTAPDVDVLIVDNASTDSTGEVLARLEAFGCRVVRNTANLGFAGGMNVAYEQSRDAPVFVPMNCDAELDPTFVANAVALLDSRPRVAAVGALVRRAEPAAGKSSSRPAVDGFVVGLRLSMRTRLLDPGDGVFTTFKTNGSCPVLRRDAVEQVRSAYGSGPFDPVFDTYGEDVDLAFKLWALGWETLASSSVRATHERSYGVRGRIFDRRGRLRVNSVAARYVNAARHLPNAMLVPAFPRLVLEDVALAARQAMLGDLGVVSDVRTAWTRVREMRRELRQFRREHPPRTAASTWAVMQCRGLPATRVTGRRLLRRAGTPLR